MRNKSSIIGLKEGRQWPQLQNLICSIIRTSFLESSDIFLLLSWISGCSGLLECWYWPSSNLWPLTQTHTHTHEHTAQRSANVQLLLSCLNAVREPSDEDHVGGHRGLVTNFDSSGWDFYLCMFTGEHAKEIFFFFLVWKEAMFQVSDVCDRTAVGFSPSVREVTFFKESSCLLVCSSTVMCQLTVNNKCNIRLSAANAP